MKKYKLKFDLPWFNLKKGDVFEAIPNWHAINAPMPILYDKVKSGLRSGDHNVVCADPWNYPHLFEEIIEKSNVEKWEEILSIFSVRTVQRISNWYSESDVEFKRTFHFKLAKVLNENGYDANKLYEKKDEI